MPTDIEKFKNGIDTELTDHIKDWRRKGGAHQLTYDVVAGSSVLLSLGVTVAGLYNRADLAAILGAVLTAFVLLQQLFPFRDMAYHYRCRAAEAEGLGMDLHCAETKDQAISVYKQLHKLVEQVATDLPRGQSAQVVFTKADSGKGKG